MYKQKSHRQPPSMPRIDNRTWGAKLWGGLKGLGLTLGLSWGLSVITGIPGIGFLARTVGGAIGGAVGGTINNHATADVEAIQERFGLIEDQASGQCWLCFGDAEEAELAGHFFLDNGIEFLNHAYENGVYYASIALDQAEDALDVALTFWAEWLADGASEAGSIMDTLGELWP